MKNNWGYINSIKKYLFFTLLFVNINSVFREFTNSYDNHYQMYKVKTYYVWRLENAQSIEEYNWLMEQYMWDYGD